MKRLAPVSAAIMLLFALAFVKHSLDKAAPGEHDEDETRAAQSSPAAAPSDPGGLLPEEFVGAAGAQYKITVGWVYDEANQPNTRALQDALGAVRRRARNSNGAASAQIVNVDVPPEDRSQGARAVTDVGIFVNGASRPELTGNPGEGGLTADRVGHITSSMLVGK